VRFVLRTRNKPIDVAITLKSKNEDDILKTIVYNPVNKDVILERTDVVSKMNNGQRNVVLKLPLTSERIVIETISKLNGRQQDPKLSSYSVENIKVNNLKKYNIDYGTGDREYLAFIENFVRKLPDLEPSDRIIRSPSGTFKIVLFEELVSYGGQKIPSPAMIGVKTGTIEVSKKHFLRLSQNQRMAVLTHEYAHFYKNPLINKSVKDEFAADMNGLTVYLSKGYGEDEYMNAFKKTFNGAKSELNYKRYDLMKKFATRIQNGEFFGKPYNL
jgi:hypothetical protein